ncbi:hypothetical protein QEZ54_19455 [Catellatospora sp. KI3]|uniref:hypothetical protein n=1 Tax=Catellatospora sp. KI3 TaxID=3041620 RepID=UPI002482166D|nr:hypothetical protein [Catellatospora sp. KI3]MDI1463160.1 hypothetical protein [Catellatospora sp. KI3]
MKGLFGAARRAALSRVRPAAAAVPRWDEVTSWFELGDPPGAEKAGPLPRSILIGYAGNGAVLLRAPEVQGIADLRSDLIHRLRHTNPECPGPPAA